MGSKEKSTALLQFLRESVQLRRKPVPRYGSDDKVFWFDESLKGRPGICSPFLTDEPSESPDMWLEVRKTRRPDRPDIPPILQHWLCSGEGEQPDKRPELLREVAAPSETETVDFDPQDEQTDEELPKIWRLEDHPEVQAAYDDYIKAWDQWAEQELLWRATQQVYEAVDFMRRRLEEAEERYELVLGVGLLVWRDPNGRQIERHILTAPGEITLDAEHGVLTVNSVATFERCNVELDMLDTQLQSTVKKEELAGLLEELDVDLWDTEKVGRVLSSVANQAWTNAQVDAGRFARPQAVDETPRVCYAPALVLRERRSTAYEDLVNRLIKRAEDRTTEPWDEFVREGDLPDEAMGESPHAGDTDVGLEDPRLYFPRPTNDEQRQIATRHRAHPCVLVKGPPGTGKSHTIANLICHLLASGERVLVTAHAPKALAVLRGLLPDEAKTLCITSLGSSREDQGLLEESVRGILATMDRWRGDEWARKEVDRLERELRRLEDQAAEIDRALRDAAEAETKRHTLRCGYEGTAAQIARRLEEDQQRYGWLPARMEDARCPLSQDEIALLSDMQERLTAEELDTLKKQLGADGLPTRDEFAAAVNRLREATEEYERVCEGVDKSRLSDLRRVSGEALDACNRFLDELERRSEHADQALGSVASKILEDLLLGDSHRWEFVAKEGESLVAVLERSSKGMGAAEVRVPAQADRPALLADAKRRLQHFRNGGWRGVWVFAPGEARATHYVEKTCRVDGRRPRQTADLEKLVAFLEFEAARERLGKLWPNQSCADDRAPQLVAADARRSHEELKRLLELFTSLDEAALSPVPAAERRALAERSTRGEWIALVRAETCRRHAEQAQSELAGWRGLLAETIASGNAHDCLTDMMQALDKRDIDGWAQACTTRDALREEQARQKRYMDLVRQLDQLDTGVGKLLLSHRGEPDWAERLRDLEGAWAWAAARAWLERITNPERVSELARRRQRLEAEIRETLSKLAATKAWSALFTRLDEKARQGLIAWSKTIKRIGKGTGKYAYKHRRSARKYLDECIPVIPAWVMPLHKLWQTATAEPGVFDTVIIDEASQAGIEALVLLLLAKRVIVVGDDKQNSPEAVGVPEEDIERLSGKHLKSFRFRAEYRPDSSLYDHIERAVGHVISLREHFRCVPEIIRFSNDLCYRDAPLIPLRQPPPNRLPPLMDVFVDSGACQGEGQRIVNRAEAERIVAQICECVKDPRYEGKTMGVIVLQGHAQAELIEQLLAEELDPGERARRELRCGVPATFQGDERDVVFLSLVIAPNHRFRALTEEEARRRFNVAMSRARDQVWLFHSVSEADLNRDDLRYQLLRFIRSGGAETARELCAEQEQLERLAKTTHRHLGDQPRPYESWFEVDVALELLRRGYRVIPQYPAAGYRIDLVVEGAAGRLAVECDGENWHGADQYDADMARQRQLERAGWTFVRVRESEFYADRQKAVARIAEECSALGISPERSQRSGEDAPAVLSVQDLTVHRISQPAAARVSHATEPAGGVTQRPVGGTTPPQIEHHAEAGSAARHGTTAVVRSETMPVLCPPTRPSGQPGYPDPRTAARSEVRAALHKLIREEGPLTKRLLFRLYVEGCPGLYRAGKSVKHVLNSVLYSMRSAKEIAIEDELGDRSLESQVIRLAGTPVALERPAGRRDIQEIPASELFLVLDRLQSRVTDLAQDDEKLGRALLEHYGFSRLTAVRAKHIARVLQAWRRRSADLG